MVGFCRAVQAVVFSADAELGSSGAPGHTWPCRGASPPPQCDILGSVGLVFRRCAAGSGAHGRSACYDGGEVQACCSCGDFSTPQHTFSLLCAESFAPACGLRWRMRGHWLRV